MWQEYINATSIEQVLSLLAERGEHARIIAGATDLILEIERGVRKGIQTLIDISRIPDLDCVHLDEDEIIHLGPLVTHSHCVASKLIQERAFPLAMAAWEVGAPQIRSRGTVAGNLITASPANDTITPLMALSAQVTLRSATSERVVPLNEFYLGVRRTVMQPDEMLVDISFPALSASQRGAFIKLGLRRAQAVAVVNVAAVLTLQGEGSNGNGYPRVRAAAVTLGSVAPTIIHSRNAEIYLEGARSSAHQLSSTLPAWQCKTAILLTTCAARQIIAGRWCGCARSAPCAGSLRERKEAPSLLSPCSYGGAITHGRAPRLEQSSQHPELARDRDDDQWAAVHFPFRPG